MFNNINFKYTDGLSELTYAPELLERAYVDLENVTTEILKPNRFIVSGSKGSGKTALAARIQLLARHKATKADWYVEIDDLERFDLSLLRYSDEPGRQRIGGTFAVWQTLLYLRLFTLLGLDFAYSSGNREFGGAYKSLTQAGFLRESSLSKINEETARKGAFARLAALFTDQVDSQGNMRDAPRVARDPAAVLSSLEGVIVRSKQVGSRYTLILDGLDYPLRTEQRGAQYLGDLLGAVKAVNEMLTRSLDAKIVLLVRDEVLRSVPDPNLAKRLTDHGVILHWYDNVRGPAQTSLVKVIEKRAHLAGYSAPITTLITEWLPGSMFQDLSSSRYGPHETTLRFILDQTRHLPRDLITAFRMLQELRKAPPFSRDDVFAALTNYSDWFYDELSDGLVGLVPESVRSSIGPLLNHLDRRFSFANFASALAARGLTSEMPADEIAMQMFRTNWIGNVWQTDTGGSRYSFAYRNRRASFDPTRECMVHRGLWKSLNLV